MPERFYSVGECYWCHREIKSRWLWLAKLKKVIHFTLKNPKRNKMNNYALLYRTKDFWYVASVSSKEILESKKNDFDNAFGSKLELLTVDETLQKINVMQKRMGLSEIIFNGRSWRLKDFL